MMFTFCQRLDVVWNNVEALHCLLYMPVNNTLYYHLGLVGLLEDHLKMNDYYSNLTDPALKCYAV